MLSILQGRNERSLGLTIVELLIVLLIMATLATLGLPLYANALDNARIAKAIADIRVVEKEILVFQLFNARLPNSLAEVGRANFRDPWKTPYEYLEISCDQTQKKCNPPKGARQDKFFKPLNWDFDLYSRGRDGETTPKLDTKKGADDIVRAVNGGYVGLSSEF
jgi:general secretion pathway protein G